MRLPLVVFAFITLISCNKKSIKPTGDNAFLHGNFEWVYSYGENNSSESFETVSDRYAIRIKENGRVEIIKNNERISKGFISVVEDFHGKMYIHFDFDGQSARLFYQNSTLEYNSFPIIDHTNVFEKQ